MKLKATLSLKDNKELPKFIRQWNSLPSRLVPTQNKILAKLVSDIKGTLDSDERPNTNAVPWRNHNYTGSLADSVFANTSTSGNSLNSSVGYGAEHGIYMEPAAKVIKNVLVPKYWPSDPIKTLNKNLRGSGGGKRKDKFSIPPREVDYNDLYAWALDILSRRTTGQKLRGAALQKKANRWAINLQKMISEYGQGGYPVIIPHAEILFGGYTDTRYDEQIIFAIRKLMKMDDEVPF